MIILALLILALLLFWSQYNLKKYGKYQRRKFPDDTNDEEILLYFDITTNQLLNFKKSKIITFDQIPYNEHTN
jgi:poly-beta-1,6-N-acetyl-D-glucosamine biosynthesis protein PgaD